MPLYGRTTRKNPYLLIPKKRLAAEDIPEGVRDLIYEMIVESTQRGPGARWPAGEIVDYMLYGEATPKGRRLLQALGWDEDRASSLDRVIEPVVKRLHQEGRVVFVDRHGYVWVVPESERRWQNVKESEIVDRPDAVNAPFNWDSL